MAQSESEMTSDHSKTLTAPSAVAFAEHFVPREQGRVYARDYPGTGSAFVLMHGLPDNLHIYDDLIPYLTSSGRRVVTFDFLGFGRSDKPKGAVYGFEQQLTDLKAVVDVLELGSIVPVAHDSSGPAALNFALKFATCVESICLLNSAYSDASPSVNWPPLIELFATRTLHALTGSLLQSPQQFGWLLEWQQGEFARSLTPQQREHFGRSIGPLIADNFIRQPSSAPAFAQMTAAFNAEMARNLARLSELEKLDVPVKLIWGASDPYLTPAMAAYRVAHLKHATLELLPAGHWVQSDVPALVAEAMLS